MKTFVSRGKKKHSKSNRDIFHIHMSHSLRNNHLKSKGSTELTSKVHLVHDLLLLLQGPSDMGEE